MFFNATRFAVSSVRPVATTLFRQSAASANVAERFPQLHTALGRRNRASLLEQRRVRVVDAGRHSWEQPGQRRWRTLQILPAASVTTRRLDPDPISNVTPSPRITTQESVMRTFQMACSVGLKGFPRHTRFQPSQILLLPTSCGWRTSSSRNMGSQSYKQHILNKNLILVSTQGGLKVEKDHKVKLIVESEKTRPLVVLLSWLLAKEKHILKFADFYLDQGFDVLTVSIQPWQMLLPVRGTQVLGAQILNFLHTNNFYQPLMLHGFSVGGYVWAETLVQINEDLKKYQPTVDRFVGQVWDSIADITEIPVGFPKAVFPRNPILQVATEKYVRYHMSAFHNVATCHYIRASQMFFTTAVKCPALFFLSKTDPIGSEESITRCRDSWDAQGIKTYMKCWDKSPHVLHYRHHPKEYAAELSAFLDRLGLLSHPEKFRAKL